MLFAFILGPVSVHSWPFRGVGPQLCHIVLRRGAGVCHAVDQEVIADGESVE
jgi:hypothetical protein